MRKWGNGGNEEMRMCAGWVGSRILQGKIYPICCFSMLKIVPIMLKLIHQFCLLASYAQTS